MNRWEPWKEGLKLLVEFLGKFKGFSKIDLVLLEIEARVSSCNFAKQYASCSGLNIPKLCWISSFNSLKKQLIA